MILKKDDIVKATEDDIDIKKDHIYKIARFIRGVPAKRNLDRALVIPISNPHEYDCPDKLIFGLWVNSRYFVKYDLGNESINTRKIKRWRF